MAIFLACPECAASVPLTAAMAGKRTTCPQCRMGLALPAALVESPVDADPEELPEARRRRSPLWSVLGIGFLVVIVVALCGGTPAAFYLLWRSGSAEASQRAAQVVVHPAGVNLPAGAPPRAIRVTEFDGVMRVDSVLNNADLVYQKNAGAGVNRNKVCKPYVIDLEAGKDYIIDLEGRGFDAYLRLEHLNGVSIAEDDDSGGDLNSRIRFTATETASYVVVATSLGGGVGGFTLIVRESRFPRPR
jgi:hypothetical protein